MYTAALAQEQTLLVFLKVGLKYSIIFCLKIYFFPLETLKGYLEVCTKKLCSLLLLPGPLPLPGLLLLPASCCSSACCCFPLPLPSLLPLELYIEVGSVFHVIRVQPEEGQAEVGSVPHVLQVQT